MLFRRLLKGTLIAAGLHASLALGMASGGQVPLPRPSPPLRAPQSFPSEVSTSVKLNREVVSSSPVEKIAIAGPLRSLLRIAGISQQAAPADVLPLLSRAIFQNGYQGSAPTEFLTLIKRYLEQARELRALAEPSGTIQVEHCEGAGRLLQILGYKLEAGCLGAQSRLHTSDPDRAFLTVDSGFPITDLEEALQRGTRFSYTYRDSLVPVLYEQRAWLKLSENRPSRSGDLVDALLDDPATARLYWAMSKMGQETASDLEQGLGLQKLLPYGALLNFYGSHISISSGHVLVPGGATAEPAWKLLVGADPGAPGPFLGRLLARDDGWLAAYYDALSRVSAAQQEQLTHGPRLAAYYAAFHAGEHHERAGAGSYSKTSNLLVLATRLRWTAEGNPYLPGSMQVWSSILVHSAKARTFTSADQVVEALLQDSRDGDTNDALQLYLTLSEIDSRRPEGGRLSPATVKLFADRYAAFDNWTLIFSEFPGLDDGSIQSFFAVADAVDRPRDRALRANTLGSFQAIVGLWQILARQKQIPAAALNSSWRAMLEAFAHVSTPNQLLAASLRSLRALSVSAGAPPGAPVSVIVELLAGPPQSGDESQRVHHDLAAKINTVLQDQQLVSLDTLSALDEALDKLEQGGSARSEMAPLIAELREFELPPALFSRGEKLDWAPGVYTTRHAELHVRAQLAELTRLPASKGQLQTAHGQLASFLRDTLVGLNYAYYEPPGAQILHINPLFVRAHDFLSSSVTQDGTVWRSPRLVGAGVSAGGGAYLMGSMVDLPYALASAEQDFIVPENIEALIWRQIVPDLLVAAILPRWWEVAPNDLHAVALYQRSGEELLRAAPGDPAMCARVLAILSHQLSPRHLEELRTALETQTATQSYLLMPSELLYLAQNYGASSPWNASTAGPASREVAELATSAPAQITREEISLRFGVPHPVLTHSTRLELLNMETFPSYSGRESRLLGESLESCNLYWARLADELGYSPAMMHLLVPELTRLMISKIFASDVEDWPAIQRAMRETGEELKMGKIPSIPRASGASPLLEITAGEHRQ